MVTTTRSDPKTLWCVLACLLFAAFGCGSTTTVTPPSTELIEREVTTTAPDGTVTVTQEQRAAAEGVGVRASGPAAAEVRADGDLPRLSLGAGRSEARSANYGASGLITPASGAKGLIVLGGLLIAGGCLALLAWGQRALGVGLIAGGGTLVGVGVLSEQYPWLWLAVPVVIAGGVVWWMIDARSGQRSRLTLGVVAKAIEDLPTELQAIVKPGVAKVAKNADAKDVVKAEILGVKR